MSGVKYCITGNIYDPLWSMDIYTDDLEYMIDQCDKDATTSRIY